jgi:hypothetical protein
MDSTCGGNIIPNAHAWCYGIEKEEECRSLLIEIDGMLPRNKELHSGQEFVICLLIT